MATRLPPIDVFVKYAHDVKPYHTKIYEVSVSYFYTEPLHVTITEEVDWDIDLNFDYFSSSCRFSGWDIPPWGSFWKPGGEHVEDVISKDLIDNFFTIDNDWTTWFASDQIDKGFRSFTIASVDNTTDVFNCPSDLPWATGDAVTLASSALPFPGILPAPILPSTTYYVIMLTTKQFKLATSQGNALANVAINITGFGAGILSVSLNIYQISLTDPNSTWTVVDVVYDPTPILSHQFGVTKIYTVESLASLTTGKIHMHAQSVWDNPLECLDPVSGLPLASYTTIATYFTEDLQTVIV